MQITFVRGPPTSAAGTRMTTSMSTTIITTTAMITTTATRTNTDTIIHMARSGAARGETNEAANPLQVGVFRACCSASRAIDLGPGRASAPTA